MSVRTKKPGYTLLELLISIAIFSGIMILAIGAFSRSASSSAKSNIVRAKSEAARTVIDQISSDFRYVTPDAAPYGCAPTQIGFCVNPAAFASVPSSVSMLLKYPDQSTYVMKTYFVSSTNPTVRVIENRDCTLANLSVCQALIANARTFLNPDYLLANSTDVFVGQSTAAKTGFLKINLNIKPKSAANCNEVGTCYQLTTTLVPGGF